MCLVEPRTKPDRQFQLPPFRRHPIQSLLYVQFQHLLFRFLFFRLLLFRSLLYIRVPPGTIEEMKSPRILQCKNSLFFGPTRKRCCPTFIRNRVWRSRLGLGWRQFFQHHVPSVTIVGAAMGQLPSRTNYVRIRKPFARLFGIRLVRGDEIKVATATPNGSSTDNGS